MRNPEGTAERRELIWPALCSFGVHTLLFLLLNSGIMAPGVVWVAGDMLPQAQESAGSSRPSAAGEPSEAVDADREEPDADSEADDADATVVTEGSAPLPAVAKFAADPSRPAPFVTGKSRASGAPAPRMQRAVAAVAPAKMAERAARPLENRTSASLAKPPARQEKGSVTAAGDGHNPLASSAAKAAIAVVAPREVRQAQATLPQERVAPLLHKAVMAALPVAPTGRQVDAQSPAAPVQKAVKVVPAAASLPAKPASAAAPMTSPARKEAAKVAQELSATSASDSPRGAISRANGTKAVQETGAQKETPQAPVPKTAAQPKPEQPKGVFQEAPSGDIALEVTGGGVPSVKAALLRVLFTPYAENRHNRPMTLAESRKVKTVVPAVVRTKEETIKAVIEVAPAGVYEFQWGAAVDGVGEARCVLSLPGSRRKHKSKTLGTSKPGEGRVIVKVLMPEGVLWDDEASFNGSIEDGESVTKYNSDTGLTWKEYKR